MSILLLYDPEPYPRASPREQTPGGGAWVWDGPNVKHVGNWWNDTGVCEQKHSPEEEDPLEDRLTWSQIRAGTQFFQLGCMAKAWTTEVFFSQTPASSWLVPANAEPRPALRPPRSARGVSPSRARLTKHMILCKQHKLPEGWTSMSLLNLNVVVLKL